MNIFNTKPTTVDGVMAAFNETIANLQGVADLHNEKAAAQARIAVEARAAEAAATAEAERATTIAGKMKALLA